MTELGENVITVTWGLISDVTAPVAIDIKRTAGYNGYVSRMAIFGTDELDSLIEQLTRIRKEIEED